MKIYRHIGYLWIGVLSMTHCQQSARSTSTEPPHTNYNTIRKDDSLLKQVNGKWFYRNQPFTGCIEERKLQGTLLSCQNFSKGKEEGWSTWYYSGGQVLARRYFHEGEKDSIHQGWWPNRQIQFEYHFHSGTYQGWFKEWYASGQPLKAIWYDKGQEQYGTGWRENGKVYMSFVVKNGRVYGLVNPNLCYTLKNEKGEYIQSVAQ